MDGDFTERMRVFTPGWAWARDNFSLPSLLVIAGIIGAGTVWCLNLSHQVNDQGKDTKALVQSTTGLTTSMQAMAIAVATLAKGQEDQSNRLKEIEDDRAHALQVLKDEDARRQAQRLKRGR